MPYQGVQEVKGIWQIILTPQLVALTPFEFLRYRQRFAIFVIVCLGNRFCFSHRFPLFTDALLALCLISNVHCHTLLAGGIYLGCHDVETG